MKIVPTFQRLSQRGVSLVFALITIVALSLAAVALIRSVDSGTLILGNLGFKQDTQLAAEDGSRAAIKWLSHHIATADLHNHDEDNGYWASAHTPVDVTGNHLATLGNGRTLIDWDGNNCAGVVNTTYAQCRDPADGGDGVDGAVSLANADIEGVKVRYIIFRLCSGEGDPNIAGATIHCAKPMVVRDEQGAARGTPDYPKYERCCAGGVPQYFRIIVRAKGKRETVTYTETLVHF